MAHRVRLKGVKSSRGKHVKKKKSGEIKPADKQS